MADWCFRSQPCSSDTLCVPWYAPLILAVVGATLLRVAEHVEQWMATGQQRFQQVSGLSTPRPGTPGARLLTTSRTFSRWFVRASGVYLLCWAVVDLFLVLR